MGVNTVHYVVAGIVITPNEDFENFKHCWEVLSSIEEPHEDFALDYYDNPYNKNIVPTKSGIHIIVDGMSAKYIVIGKILAKSQQGFEMMSFPFNTPSFTSGGLEEYKAIYPGILDIDRNLGTKFGGMQAGLIVFTHWHQEV